VSAPRWVAALVRLLAPSGRAEDAIGDLNEMHGRRVARRGRLIGTLQTTLGAIDMAGALLVQRIRGAEATPGRAAQPDADLTVSRKPGRWDARHLLDGWIGDLAGAGRSLRRAPGFVVVTVMTLGLAIGANTAIFSVVDTVLLDPLDYPAADRLVAIYASAPGSDLPEEFGPAAEFYLQYKEGADLLEDVGIFRDGQTTARWADQIDRLFIALATPSIFSALGVTPAMGRLPSGEDDPGSVALISHRLWTTWFGADPNTIGRSFEVSGQMRTIVGVMRPEFRFPDDRVTVWLHHEFADDAQIRPGNFAGEYLLARVRPGTDFAALESQLAGLASRLPERFGGSQQYREIIEKHRPVVRSLEEELVGDIAGPLWLLLGTVAIVLLIACTNVANLFSVRAESRRRDFDVRQALGAGRLRLIRTQMSEAVLLAGLGGAVGLLLAWVSLPLLVRFAPENIPNLDAARLDSAALLFTAGIAILTAFVFGLVPAVRFSRPRLVGAMRQSGGIGEHRRRWGRDALILIQTASALVLLVGSGLLMRSFWTLTHVDPGYDTENIFSFQVSPRREGLVDGPTYARFHEGFMERVAALPGVQFVGLTNWLPLDEGAGTNRFLTERMQLTGDQPPRIRMTFVGGEYFRTMGIGLERGRVFERSDQNVGAATVIVSASAAAQLWPGEDPIGKTLLHDDDATSWLRVVGVVENIFLDDFRQDAPDPMVYLPMVGPTAESWAVGSPAYVVRSTRADVMAPEIRALMRAHVPESPMYRVFTMEALAQRSMAQLSFTMLMLAIASGLALLLGAVGLYGVLSYVVSTRKREIAVRMAVGAADRTVRRMVVLQGARLTAAGVVTGLFAAAFLTRLLDSLLFGVGTLDVPTFAAMSGLMMAIALVASYVPARRASSVNPMEALRAE